MGVKSERDSEGRMRRVKKGERRGGKEEARRERETIHNKHDSYLKAMVHQTLDLDWQLLFDTKNGAEKTDRKTYQAF